MAKIEDILELNLKELQSLWENITKSNDQLRAKGVTLLIGEIAMVTFLFGGSIPMPTIIYGVVFYWIGIGLLVLSFFSFLWIISPSRWTHPVDLDSAEIIKKKYPTRKSYLENITAEYIAANAKNSARLDSRTKPFVRSIFMISIGIFIMLMIKYGGGTI